MKYLFCRDGRDRTIFKGGEGLGERGQGCEVWKYKDNNCSFPKLYLQWQLKGKASRDIFVHRFLWWPLVTLTLWSISLFLKQHPWNFWIYLVKLFGENVSLYSQPCVCVKRLLICQRLKYFQSPKTSILWKIFNC